MAPVEARDQGFGGRMSAPPLPGSSLPAWLEALAAHRSRRAALVDDAGSLTYGELGATVTAVAARLHRRGLRRGDVVATTMVPSIPHLIVLLGCLRAGVGATPVNTRLTASEARQYLSKLEPALVVADEEHAALAGALGPDVVQLPDADQPGSLEVRLGPLGSGEVGPPPPLPDPDSLALIFPTGGTTGIPKGAYYDHGSMMAWMKSVMMADPHTPEDLDLFCSPFFHVTLGVGLLSRLVGAGTLRIQPRFDPTAVLAAIDAGATRITMAPTMLTAVRRDPSFERTRRDRVRAVTFGSSAVTEAFVRDLVSDYPAATVRTAYGATEVGPVTGMEHADLLAGRLGGVGRPLPGVRMKILDSAGVELPRGEVGDLVIASPWQTLGYYGNEEETARVFRADGVHIGDTGRFEETEEGDWLHIVGRSKEMIVTGGENVFPIEVETVLAEHPAVDQVVAYGAPDDYWGERVEVAVITVPGAGATLEELREFGRGRLAGYKLPRGLRLPDRIPLTPNNKPDRIALQRHAAAEPNADGAPAEAGTERRR
jgi:fatty-acyl-CoA synthase